MASHAPHVSYGQMVVVLSLKVHVSSIGYIDGIMLQVCSAFGAFLSQGMERESMMEQALVSSVLCVDISFVMIASDLEMLDRL